MINSRKIALKEENLQFMDSVASVPGHLTILSLMNQHIMAEAQGRRNCSPDLGGKKKQLMKQ